jgi:hypothetical protein
MPFLCPLGEKGKWGRKRERMERERVKKGGEETGERKGETERREKKGEGERRKEKKRTKEEKKKKDGRERRSNGEKKIKIGSIFLQHETTVGSSKVPRVVEVVAFHAIFSLLQGMSECGENKLNVKGRVNPTRIEHF